VSANQEKLTDHMRPTRNADVTHQISEGGLSQPSIIKADESLANPPENPRKFSQQKFKLLTKHVGSIENSEAKVVSKDDMTKH